MKDSISTVSAGGGVPAPRRERGPQTVGQYLEERAKSHEVARDKSLKALETFPKVLLDMYCQDLADIGIYL